MKVMNILFGSFWVLVGIAALCGVEWNAITVGCACICAATGFFNDASHS